MNHLDEVIQRHPRLFHGQAPDVHSWVPTGWLALIDQIFESIGALLDDEQAARFKVFQIKEKFGTLRVYWALRDSSGADDPQAAADVLMRARLRQLVDDACKQTEFLCEDCGQPSGLRCFRGWWTTRCDACRARDRSS